MNKLYEKETHLIFNNSRNKKKKKILNLKHKILFKEN